MERARYIKSYATAAEEQAELDNGTLRKSYVAFIEDGRYIDWNTKGVDYTSMPLTFKIISGGTITFAGYSTWFDDVYVSASTNNGETWESWQATVNGTAITVEAGDKLVFLGNNDRMGRSNASAKFGGTALFEAYGNPMSLLNAENYQSMSGFNKDFALARIFINSQNIIMAKHIVLPATELRKGCYYEMFNGARNLIEGPVLTYNPTAELCYEGIFKYTSVNKVVCLANNPDRTNTINWLFNASPTGTFVKHPDAVWERGPSGIPEGWTVIDADI